MLTYVTNHQDYLKNELKVRSLRNPLYSQRAFARDIGLSASSLNEYLKGRYSLSSARVSQISKSIGLTNEQKTHWVDLLSANTAKNDEDKKVSQIRVNARLQAQKHSITIDEYKVISDWYHFAYLELIEMNAAMYSDLKTAAKSLGIDLKTLKAAVGRLETIGFLIRNEVGLYQVDSMTSVGDEIPSEAIRHYHAQILRKAAAALENQPMNQRYNSSTMVSLPKESVQDLLEELKSTALKILQPHVDAAQNKPKDSLYCLSIQFFDLLQSAKGQKHE
jgi:uncharacterized protein (TIGR02147 family)